MPEIIFNGLFRVIAMRLVTPGNWYIGFRSKVSGKLFAILDDPTGTGQLRAGGSGTFEVETPETGSISGFRAPIFSSSRPPRRGLRSRWKSRYVRLDEGRPFIRT